MKLPKELTNVTPFSKFLAMALFIILPLFTFWLGIQFVTPKHFIPIEQSATVPTSEIINSEMNDWKNYSSDRYSYTFRYPADAQVEESVNSTHTDVRVTFIGEKQKVSGRTQTNLLDGYIFRIIGAGSTADNTIDSFANEMYKKTKDSCFPQTKFSAITVVTIAGKNAMTYTVKDCMGDSTEYFIASPDSILEISQLYAGDSQHVSDYRRTLDMILSSFRFVR